MSLRNCREGLRRAIRLRNVVLHKKAKVNDPTLLRCTSAALVSIRSRSDDKNISSLFQPLHVKPVNNPDDISVGAELVGEIKKGR